MYNMRSYIHGKYECFKFYISTFFETDFTSNTSLQQAVSDMHILAYVYHWDRDTLWLLPRSERKMWAEMVLEQKKAENKSINNSGNSPNTYTESN